MWQTKPAGIQERRETAIAQSQTYIANMFNANEGMKDDTLMEGVTTQVFEDIIKETISRSTTIEAVTEDEYHCGYDRRQGIGGKKG